MQHLRIVHSWKFRLLQSDLGLLRKERLHKAHSPTLSEFRSSYSAISCKARTNIQASIQSKNWCHFPWQWYWCSERFFSSSVHLSGIRIKLQDTHIIFSFDLSYPFSDSRGTTRSGTTISLHLLLPQAIFIPRTLSSHQRFCSSPSFLSQYEELPLSLTEANACVHRTE